MPQTDTTHVFTFEVKSSAMPLTPIKIEMSFSDKKIDFPFSDFDAVGETHREFYEKVYEQMEGDYVVTYKGYKNIPTRKGATDVDNTSQ